MKCAMHTALGHIVTILLHFANAVKGHITIHFKILCRAKNVQSTAWRYCHIPTSQGRVQNSSENLHICLVCIKKRSVHCNLVQSSALQCSKLCCSGAQQELTTATYLTAMKPATVGDTTQHYRGKKTELGLLYLCLKMSPKDREERRDIWG